MATAEEVLAKVTAALRERVGDERPCVVCGHTAWVVSTRFVVLTAQLNPLSRGMRKEAFPLLPVVCTHCGNTHLLNLRVLGFSDLKQIEISEDESE